MLYVCCVDLKQTNVCLWHSDVACNVNMHVAWLRASQGQFTLGKIAQSSSNLAAKLMMNRQRFGRFYTYGQHSSQDTLLVPD